MFYRRVLCRLLYLPAYHLWLSVASPFLPLNGLCPFSLWHPVVHLQRVLNTIELLRPARGKHLWAARCLPIRMYLPKLCMVLTMQRKLAGRKLNMWVLLWYRWFWLQGDLPVLKAEDLALSPSSAYCLASLWGLNRALKSTEHAYHSWPWRAFVSVSLLLKPFLCFSSM